MRAKMAHTRASEQTIMWEKQKIEQVNESTIAQTTILKNATSFVSPKKTEK